MDGPWNAESWCHHALATVSLRRLQVAGVVHAGVAVHARRTVEGEAREGDEDLLEESGSLLTTTAAAITSSSSSLSPPYEVLLHLLLTSSLKMRMSPVALARTCPRPPPSF